jgi:hypothetical protein
LKSKMFVLRHWKAILTVAQIGLFALLVIAVGKANAESIDTPFGP